MKTSSEPQLTKFLAKYNPEIARTATEVLAKLRARFPGANQLVYDNYNALAIGFASSDRASDAVVSIALYPRWVSLFFLNGVELDDPMKLLKGSGKQVRHIVLKAASDVDNPDVQALLEQEFEILASRGDGPQNSELIIKSISAKQRPRRPAK